MNFGNFFRNISVDKQSENVGGLFGTPSRLFESINAKTESIVSDFSQKVDLGGKIDTIKKYSNIDKIGQSVLGASFQSKPTDESGNEKPQQDSVLQPQAPQPEKKTSYQFGKDMPKTQSQASGQKEEFSSMSFEQPSKQQSPSRDYQTEKSSEWPMSADQSQALPIVPEKPANKPGYQYYSERFNLASDNPSYENHPTRGNSFQNRQSQDRNAFANQISQDQFSTNSLEQSMEKNNFQNTQIKQLSTGGEFDTKDEYSSWKSQPKNSTGHEKDLFSENDDYKRMPPIESSFGSRLEREEIPLAWQSPSKGSFSLDAEPFRKKSSEQAAQPRQPSLGSHAEYSEDQSTCQSLENSPTSREREILNRNDSQSFASDSYSFSSQQSSNTESRHENSLNKGMSLDTLGTKKEKPSGITAFKRQNTTPGPRPPRPPPPRSRSGSQSFQSSTNVSLDEDPPKQPPSVIKEEPFFFEAETKESEMMRNQKKSLGSQSSSEEIGYLTRLQCQEIVSAVDDMIAEAFDETRDFEPAKSEARSFNRGGNPFNRDSSISMDYWHDSISKEPEYDATQNEPHGKEGYYVTELADSGTATYQTDNEISSDYQPSYEKEKNKEPHHYEQQNTEAERDRSSPNIDDWYSNYDCQQRSKFDEEEEEETYPSVSREAEFQKPATETEDQAKLFITEYVRILVTGE